MKGKNILVIYSSINVTRRDATGAFIPEARAFAKCHEVPEENVVGIDCKNFKAPQRFTELCMALRDRRGIQLVALFCHGWSSGMQFGMNKTNIPMLVQYMKLSCMKDVKLILYACSTASTSKKTRSASAPGTDNGYADKLRDEMLKVGFRGGWIDAHLTPGHTTQNPFLVRLYVEPPFEGGWDVKGGEWLVSPKSAIWPRWKSCVQNRKSNFRFRFPLYTEDEIHEFLRSMNVNNEKEGKFNE